MPATGVHAVASVTYPRTPPRSATDRRENDSFRAWEAGVAEPQSRLSQVYRMIPEVEAFAAARALQLSGASRNWWRWRDALMCGTRLLLLDEAVRGVAPVLAHRLAEVIAAEKPGASRSSSRVRLSHSQESSRG